MDGLPCPMNDKDAYIINVAELPNVNWGWIYAENVEPVGGDFNMDNPEHYARLLDAYNEMNLPIVGFDIIAIFKKYGLTLSVEK